MMNWLRAVFTAPSAIRAIRVCAMVLVCAALVKPAFADDRYGFGGDDDHHNWGGDHDDHHNWGGDHHGYRGGEGHHSSGGGSGGSAPEIDPNALTGALTLLGGGIVVLTDRFRKK